MPGKKIFVGGLSWNTTDTLLREAFEEFGTVVEAKVIYDRETDRSKGFGFVLFGNGDDAERAMYKMNGTDLDGRTIRVDWATEKSRDDRGRDRDKAPRRHRDR